MKNTLKSLAENECRYINGTSEHTIRSINPSKHFINKRAQSATPLTRPISGSC